MNLSDEEARKLKPGDRVYTWVFVGRDRGIDKQDMMEGIVVKVCAKTVLIDWQAGGGYRRYTPFHMIGGRVDW